MSTSTGNSGRVKINMSYTTEDIATGASQACTTQPCEHELGSGAGFPLQDHELLDVSVDLIVAACEKTPSLQERTNIHRISEGAVVKFNEFMHLAEARNMEFVRKMTCVRLPRVVRSFEFRKQGAEKMTYIVMEFIRGDELTHCWDTFSESRRQNVCQQVIDIISDLRFVEVQVLRPIGGGLSRGPWFTEFHAGPFHTVRELEDWFTHKLDVCKLFKRVEQTHPPFTDRFGKMVMSHMDIAARNIILDNGDKVCLVDWDFAGAYPVYFEMAALKMQSRKPDADFCKRILVHFPEYDEEVNELFSLMYALTTAALA